MDSRFLEVDINGEEVFMVDKRVISSYSGRINKLLSNSKNGVVSREKVIFHDFPGGPATFELITRFCYNKGKANINPHNISHLICASHFMKMSNLVAGVENLCEQTEKSLQEIKYWTWSELLTALKQCQELSPSTDSIRILDKLLDSLIGRLPSSCETTPCPSTSSPDSSSAFRLSCETRSSDSLKNNLFRSTWWFEDLASLQVHIIEKMISLMVSRNFDNGIIAKFLFYYQKSRSLSDEKVKIVEKVVEMLYSLDISYVSYKSLFDLLRVSLSVKLSCREKLESMIGVLLHQASLDNLLVPSPVKKSYLYDMNLVLRFLKSFFMKGVHSVPLSRLKKVANLMDLYLAEIAPDPFLKPSKFLAVIRALPDSARDSFDGVYLAMNLYLEVHSSLSEEEKMKVCRGLKYEKLSSQMIKELSRNINFPSKCAVRALNSQQRKLKNLLEDSTDEVAVSRSFQRPPDGSQQTVLFAKKLDLSGENEKLKIHLEGMQWRVGELEKVFEKMQIQMAKMMKSRLPSNSSGKSVPKLCS